MNNMIICLCRILFLVGIALLAGCDDDDAAIGTDADAGSDEDGDADGDCATCHPDFPPETGQHLAHQMKCFNCHAEVVDRNDKIIDQQKHEDGEPDISLYISGAYDAGSRNCTNACHHAGVMNW